MNTLPILRPPPQREKLPDDSHYINKFYVKSESSNRLYVISQSRNGRWWACSCTGWIAHKHCKHLKALQLPGNYKPHEVLLQK